jgi:hypothetical protein
MRDLKALLAEWEKVREGMLRGRVTGFHTGLRDESGVETIYMGGVYQGDPQAALRAILKVSAQQMLAEDGPLPPKKRRA